MAADRTTARTTGALYLALAVSGMLAFLVVRDQLYVPDDAAATLANLVERPGLARFGIAADLTLVVTQALTALWFLKLFHPVERGAAVAIAAFGTVNAVIILGATVCSSVALAVATGAATAVGGDPAGTVGLLYALNDAAWALGGLFFGLWLIPMGWAVVRSGLLPQALGWTLVAGGVGYVLSAYAGQLLGAAPVPTDVLTVPASVGEFAMIGYLLLVGVRPRSARRPAPGPAAPG